MSGARFVTLEKEYLSHMEGKPVSGKNANIFMMHFHFLALRGKCLYNILVFTLSLLRAPTML